MYFVQGESSGVIGDVHAQMEQVSSSLGDKVKGEFSRLCSVNTAVTVIHRVALWRNRALRNARCKLKAAGAVREGKEAVRRGCENAQAAAVWCRG
jgi:hypothetical protein